MPEVQTRAPLVSRLPLFLAAAVLALVLAACDKGDANAEPDAEEAPAIPVEVARPTRGDINAAYSGTAPIEAFADATVIAKVGGEVRQVMVEEGDEVSRGQVLARLDGDRLRLEMEQAEANLHKLQRDHQRNLDLKARGLISEGDFDTIQYDMEALQATFDLAKLEFDYTEIRAPIDGIVSQRFIKLGNTIDAGAATFQITTLEPLVSYLHVPEREFRKIAAGQTAVIRVDALQGLEFRAAVARIAPVVDADTGTFKVTVEVSDPSRRLKPGMFGRISIVYDSRAMALQIPRSALVEEAGDTAVFVVDADKAVRRIISTGYVDAGNIEVTSGLDDDDRVIVVGQSNLKDGARIAVIDAAPDTVHDVDPAAIQATDLR